MHVILCSWYPLSEEWGVEIFLKELKSGLEKRKVNCEIVTLEKKEIEQLHSEKTMMTLLLYKKLIDKVKPGSVLHFQGATSVLAPLFPDNPKIVTMHGTSHGLLNAVNDQLKFSKQLYTRFPIECMEYIGTNNCDKVVCVSNKVKNEVAEGYKVSSNKLTTIRTGLSMPAETISKEHARLKLKLPLNKILILSVGRGDVIKGGKLFFDIALQYKNRKDVLFLMAGSLPIVDNKKYPWLMVKRFKHKDMPYAYSASDVFLSCSAYEGFGLHILEAAQYGLPLISFDVGIANEVIHTFRNGYLSEEKDIADVKLNLELLIKDIIHSRGSIANFFSNESKEIAKTFDKEEMVDQYMELYVEMWDA